MRSSLHAVVPDISLKEEFQIYERVCMVLRLEDACTMVFMPSLKHSSTILETSFRDRFISLTVGRVNKTSSTGRFGTANMVQKHMPEKYIDKRA